MKFIIYAALGLIICASGIGFADYYSAKKQGKLIDYNASVVSPVVSDAVTTQPTDAKQEAEKTNEIKPRHAKYRPAKTMAFHSAKRKLTLNDFSRAPLPPPITVDSTGH